MTSKETFCDQWNIFVCEISSRVFLNTAKFQCIILCIIHNFDNDLSKPRLLNAIKLAFLAVASGVTVPEDINLLQLGLLWSGDLPITCKCNLKCYALTFNRTPPVYQTDFFKWLTKLKAKQTCVYLCPTLLHGPIYRKHNDIMIKQKKKFSVWKKKVLGTW